MRRLCVFSLLLSLVLFFFNDTATTQIYTLSLHDALPILKRSEFLFRIPFTFAALIWIVVFLIPQPILDENEFYYLWYVMIPLGTLWFRAFVRSEEHTSELQSQSNLVCRLLLEKKKEQY